MNNSIGNIYRLTSFGESHGPAIGGVIDGMPAGVAIDTDELQRQLDRRRPGQSDITTPRKEADRVKLLSGIFEGVTTGTSIGFIVENSDQHSSDYDNMRHLFRPPCRLHIHCKIRPPRPSRRRTIVGTRNDSACRSRFTRPAGSRSCRNHNQRLHVADRRYCHRPAIFRA